MDERDRCLYAMVTERELRELQAMARSNVMSVEELARFLLVRELALAARFFPVYQSGYIG